MQATQRLKLHQNWMLLRSHFSGNPQHLNFAKASFSTDSKVQFHDHSPHVTEFKLNVPKTLNSLDLDMCHIMLGKIQTWFNGSAKPPRVVVMTGAGEKAFCAGGDIVSLYKAHVDPAKD